MHYIVYVSAAVKPFTASELKDLLKESRDNNTRVGITGLLLYSEGMFMQLLEGYEDPVKQIFQKIEVAKRHTCVLKTAEGTTRKRIFAEWAMAFEAVSTKELVKLRAFINPADLHLDPHDLREPIVMLKAFFDSRRSKRPNCN